MKKGIIIIAVVLIALITVLVAGENKTDRIRIPVNVQVMNTEEQGAIMKQAFGDIDEEKAERIENLSVLEETKAELSEFLLEKYKFSAKEKLAELNFYKYEGTELSARGYHDNGTKNLFLNNWILSNWSNDDIKFIVAHEMLHYLGLNQIDSAHWFLYEATTAAVTDAFVKWAGYNISQTDSYQSIMRLVQQMELCNPDLIYNHLHGIQRVDESIDEVLTDMRYPYYSTNGYRVSQLLGALLQYNILAPDIYNLFTVQEIADVYCKQFEHYKEVKEEYCSLYLVQDFDKIYFIKQGKSYVPTK